MLTDHLCILKHLPLITPYMKASLLHFSATASIHSPGKAAGRHPWQSPVPGSAYTAGTNSYLQTYIIWSWVRFTFQRNYPKGVDAQMLESRYKYFHRWKVWLLKLANHHISMDIFTIICLYIKKKSCCSQQQETLFKQGTSPDIIAWAKIHLFDIWVTEWYSHLSLLLGRLSSISRIRKLLWFT